MSNRIHIGIDPGASSGAVVVLYPEGDMVSQVYDEDAIVELFDELTYRDEAKMCCLEHVWSYPNQGHVGTFSFGHNAGFYEGLLRAYKIPFQKVAAQRWKAEFDLIKKDDKEITEICQNLFPDYNLLATPRSWVPHTGIVDALFMAEYSRRKL